jgi:hypothetical protein
LPGDLLWRRFNPLRPGCLPLRVLENLKFRGLSRRKKTLQRGGLDFCAFISILGLSLETVLLGGELLFSLALAGLFRPDLLSGLWENLGNIEIFIFAAYCLNYILTESLTVCMGFGVYINSRVEVEGWDIEILLRRFAESGAERSGPALDKTAESPLPEGSAADRGKSQAAPLGGAGVLLLLWLAPVLFPLPGYAGGPESAGMSGEVLSGSFEDLFAGQDEDASGEILAEILGSPDFGSEREGWGIRFKNRGEAGELPEYLPAPWMEAVKKGFAYVLRFCVILVLGGAAVFLILRLAKLRRWGSPSPKNGSSRNLFDPPPEAPGALLNRAELFYGQGRYRDAWALCLAGAIAAYDRYRGLSFPPDATEYECLALVRSAAGGSSPADGSRGEEGGPGEARGFAALVLCWVSLAYGGKVPGPGAFESSLAFCRSLLLAPKGEETSHG